MKRMRRLHPLLAVLLIAATLGLATIAARAEERFTFAVIGDAPYFPHEAVYLRELLRSLGGEPISFVVHVGDLKSGSSRCDKPLYEARLRLLDSSPKPLVYVPGDNDWADCHRTGFNPRSRLELLRELFYSESYFALGQQKMQLTRQSLNPAYTEYREHQNWFAGGIELATLHVIGNGNRFGPGESARKDSAERMKATLAWMRETFASARHHSALGVVLFIHADPGFEIPRTDRRRTGYNVFLDELAEAASKFERPVLVVHGDTHTFRVYRPANHRGAQMDNVTVLSTFGSPFVNWVRVAVDPNDPGLFVITPEYGSPFEAERSQ